jgi:cytochrome c biogenesis protein CcdA
MLLLIIFGFVAGAATAVSPCVVPVLPIALSAGVTGGRRRPLGVVTGLVVSFTFALFALVYVISACRTNCCATSRSSSSPSSASSC